MLRPLQQTEETCEMKHLYGTAIVVVALAAVGCAEMPTSPSQVTSSSFQLPGNRAGGRFTLEQLSGSDSALASAQANAVFNLIRLGTLAENRGDTRVVKNLGRQLFQDYSLAEQDLDDLAGSAVMRSAGFDSADQATYSQLLRLSGSEFDRAFMAAIIAELTSSRTSFQQWSTSAESSQLRAHASNMVSKLSRHLAMALDVDTYL